jgi:hypothetical protein
VTETCVGWQHRHRVDHVHTVRLAYAGARLFPSEHVLCDQCIAKVRHFVDELRQQHGPEAVDVSIDGVPSTSLHERQETSC